MLRTYDPFNNVIGFQSLLITDDFFGMKTLSLRGSNIAHVVFGAEAPAGAGSSVYADNFRFGTDAAPVPEPASLLLVGAGLIAGSLPRFRRGKRFVRATLKVEPFGDPCDALARRQLFGSKGSPPEVGAR